MTRGAVAFTESGLQTYSFCFVELIKTFFTFIAFSGLKFVMFDLGRRFYEQKNFILEDFILESFIIDKSDFVLANVSIIYAEQNHTAVLRFSYELFDQMLQNLQQYTESVQKLSKFVAEKLAHPKQLPVELNLNASTHGIIPVEKVQLSTKLVKEDRNPQVNYFDLLEPYIFEVLKLEKKD